MLWKMCGIDVHMDPNIGKRLNALGNTLTSLTGEEDIDDIADLNSVNMADLSDEDEADSMSPTIHMVSHAVQKVMHSLGFILPSVFVVLMSQCRETSNQMLLVLFEVRLEFGAHVPVVSLKSKMDAFVFAISIVSPYTFVTAQKQHTICLGRS